MRVNLLLSESPELLPILRYGGSGIMSVRSVQPGGNLLSDVALTVFGIASISIPLALVIILICR